MVMNMLMVAMAEEKGSPKEKMLYLRVYSWEGLAGLNDDNDEDFEKDNEDADNGGYDNHAGQAFPLFVVLAGRSLSCHQCQLDLQVPYMKRCQVEVRDMAQIKSGMLGRMFQNAQKSKDLIFWSFGPFQRVKRLRNGS